MDELLQDFLTETAESLSSIDNDLVAFEQAPDNPDLIRNIFRMVHTIKGTCGFIGLPRLGQVAHSAENVLGMFRDGKLAPSSENIEVVLEAIDCIKTIVTGIETQGAEPAGDDTALLGRLDAIFEGKSEAVEPEIETDEEEPETAPAEELPEPEAAAPEAALEPVETAVPQMAAPGQTHSPKAPPAPAAEPAASGAAVQTNQTVRVSISLLETLMTAVSELVLTRNQLVQGIREVEVGSVKVPLQRLSQIVSELQEGVMKTRMQPIGNAWQTLPRMIRDLARELDKKVDLQLLGSETEVDRQVLEIIKDPLTHMIRNSADHGLEQPAERLAAGKPETGRITVSACHQGGHIVIEVADDGRGLNTARIRQKLVEKGLVSEAAAAQLGEAQVHRYIFDAGFSTAASVTAVSGRGVGMDVVRTNIEKIGGSIELHSVEGKGTKFTIRIPLTLAIAAALIIETAGERFAIPQVAVLELVMVSPTSEHKIEMINGAPLLRLRDRLLPLVYLGQTLGISDTVSHEQAYILVLQAGSQKFGVAVDRVLDTEEIVVKPVAPILKELPIYAGNTILGDGSVIMILDINGLAAMIAKTDADEADRGEVGATATTGSALSRVLVFETGEGGPTCAIPLDRVDRIENLDLATVEMAADRRVVQYRGGLMPVVEIGDQEPLPGTGVRPMLVFGSSRGAFGVVLTRIVDVVEASLESTLAARNPAYLGTAIIAGRATEIINIENLAEMAFPNDAGFGAVSFGMAA